MRVFRSPITSPSALIRPHSSWIAAGAALLNAELMVARLKTAGAEADRELDALAAARDVQIHQA